MLVGLLLNPNRSIAFCQGLLEYQDLEDDDSVLGSANLSELLDDDERGCGFRLEVPSHEARGGTWRLTELVALAELVTRSRARRIFEIGTHTGRTTSLLATHVGTEGKVFTLDLPQALVAHSIGSAFRGTAQEAQIRSLTGDSREFDFTPFRDSIDICWVDGSHQYRDVTSDTRSAFLMVRDGGWIAWHDYRHTAWWSGVTRAVRETKRRTGGSVVHIRGTTVAIARVTVVSKRRMLIRDGSSNPQ